MKKHSHIESIQFDPQVLDLLNGSIDGELSTMEQAKLDKLLTDSAALRELNEELQALTDILEGLPEREPPGYLHTTITSQVRLPLPGGLQGQKPGFFSVPWVRTGLAVAAGLVLTVGIYQTGMETLSPEEASSMTGTIVKNVQGQLLDSTGFNTELMNGKAELRIKDGLLFVDVHFNSDGIAIVKLDLSGQNLEYAGIDGLKSQAADVAVANGSISVTSSGPQHYELLLRRTVEFNGNSPTPLEVEFFAGNVLVHEAELSESR